MARLRGQSEVTTHTAFPARTCVGCVGIHECVRVHKLEKQNQGHASLLPAHHRDSLQLVCKTGTTTVEIKPKTLSAQADLLSKGHRISEEKYIIHPEVEENKEKNRNECNWLFA